MKLTVHLTNNKNKFSMKKKNKTQHIFSRQKRKYLLDLEDKDQNNYREWNIKCKILKEVTKTLKDTLDSEQKLLC